MSSRFSPVVEAHRRLQNVLKPGDVAVDATVGNGHDTLFLLQSVAPSGRVYGFDIQNSALANARKKIAETGFQKNLVLIHASHSRMTEYIRVADHGNIAAVMFNLGYLPGGDKTVITQADSTLNALTASTRLLRVGGLMTIVAYPGHPGGGEECAAVADWCLALDTVSFAVEEVESWHGNETAPRLFSILVMKRT